jgi:hypothetical protein
MSQAAQTLPRKPRCFVSYTHEGADFQSLRAFENLLVALAGDTIEFIIDNQLEIGAKIPEHEALIEEVDAVIIILTEQYKRRIVSRAGGVYREYVKILGRLLEQEDGRKTLVATTDGGLEMAPPTKFVLLPILFAGDLDKSCPEELKGLLAGDFTAFRSLRDKRGRPKIQNKDYYEGLAKKIVDKIDYAHVGSTDSFAKTYEELFNLLFLETKHELVVDQIRPEIYVKTKSFRQVRDQYAFVLVGRKGSGKTTITKQVMLQNRKYRYLPIEIDVDYFNLEYIYELNIQPQLSSDIRSLQPQVKLFRAAWKIFIFMSSMVLAINKLGKQQIPKDVYAFCADAINDICDPNIGKIFWPLFIWSYTKASDHIDKAIVGARTDSSGFFVDMARALDETNVFESAIPKNIVNSFEAVLLQSPNLRMLFTVDGFDTNFSDFRMKTIREFGHNEQAEVRNRLELDWLRALLQVVIELKRGRSGLRLADRIDFCLTVPKDRFLEIRDYEKDAIVYQNKVCDIFLERVRVVSDDAKAAGIPCQIQDQQQKKHDRTVARGLACEIQGHSRRH